MNKGERTKQKISRESLKLFVAKGIKETSIKDIAAKTGISEGAMYRHYASKEMLAKDLFLSNYLRYAERLESLCKQQHDLKSKISAMVHYFCREFDQDRILFSYLLLSRHSELKKLTGQIKGPVVVVRTQIEQAIKQKEIENANPEVLTAMILGVVLETAQFILYGRIKETMSELADSLTQACWKIAGK
ncbi:MAG: TetR/AcrR family transcriptional regulator [Alphaproteobacteria bacterium]|nr:TetR/AcrR family transcriptional regulator [Alphaproteobacteria bacterium]MBP7759922.1 TetR/AcrR family transcriptional regulator [Alphaproteobacteria bacterium]MBP7763235.1 TetR/AcrR family transcriptional regulator [Alphaproteobacteria bacterium]MBP7906304.1 TetR/AcrR family transcriptional regulator [Alphaproteobacteria bacterium]